jgi:glycine hydroxymethyltransferase
MTDLSPDYFSRPLAEVDPEIADVLAKELDRQQRTLEMIASENFVPQAVLEAQGSVLTNKYAEGYPGKRYYGGCEHVDVAEQLAIDRAKELFGAEHANVQPHAGAQANAAVFHALLTPGDTIMGLSLAHGGHLTHGMKINFSGRLFDVAPYEVDRETSLIDMDAVARVARERRPEDDHRGLVGLPPPPGLRALPGDRRRGRRPALRRHGALRRPRRGRGAPEPRAARRRGDHHGPQDARRPALGDHPVQGGARQEDQLGGLPRPAGRPARARHRREGRRLPHRDERGLPRAPAPHDRRRAGRRGRAAEAGHGLNVLTGGTDVHLALVDLRETELDGQQAEDRLHEIGITVNRNAVPFDPRPPMVTSGLRVGTPALATRGFTVDDFHEVGRIIAAALTPGFEDRRADLADRVSALADRHPLYEHLAAPAAAV